MTARDHVLVLLKELDAQRLELSLLAGHSDADILARFHAEVTLPLSSLAARANNMEWAQKTLPNKPVNP